MYSNRVWYSRANSENSPTICVEGDKPEETISTASLILMLQADLRKGFEQVTLAGLGTLHINGRVLLTTESQI